MRIIIGADLVPTQSNMKQFVSGKVENLLNNGIFSALNSVDFRIFNLEVPLTNVKNPIEKIGSNLIAPTNVVNGIKAFKADLLTLANNHIMDQNVQGLYSTINALTEKQINFVGAGKNLEEAQKPYIIEKDGIKVGVYACAEYEFSIAKEDRPGANPFDPFESLEHIAGLKKQCECVIVLYHGGKEYYRYPSPYLRKACRKMCEKGADVVICQHSHCIGCEEKYNDSTIIYGQGNFLFDHSDSEFWQTSLLVCFNTDDKSIEYIPLQKEGCGVSLADNNKQILQDFYKRSEEIKQKGFIEKKYSEFAEKMSDGYLYALCEMSLLYRIISKVSRHRIHMKIGKKRQLKLRNYIECEAHRELMLQGLHIEGRDTNDEIHL